ncbi:hypothetical protein MBE73_004897, partial [Klebsiella pneumoniae]
MSSAINQLYDSHHIFAGIIYNRITWFRNSRYKKAGWRDKSKTVTQGLPFLVLAPSPVGEGWGEGISPHRTSDYSSAFALATTLSTVKP